MNKEAIESILIQAKIAHNDDCLLCARKDIAINQVLLLLKQQPPAGEWTKEKIEVRIFEGKYWVCAHDWNKLKDRLDTSEAREKDLLEALEQIRDLETECCSRCEGNGRLYADGKAHLPSENADTILCGNCGGSGRILPEVAQDIAEAAIATKVIDRKKHGGCWPEAKKEG